MLIKNLVDEDFVNYKKPSMFIGTSSCDFKCDKECGRQVCQNSDLAKAPTIEIDDIEIWHRYDQNPITEAIVFGGLEPFSLESWADIYAFILKMRENTENDSDDIVIYTGYYPSEVKNILYWISRKKNLIVKFGRFIPDRPHRFDEVLGVELASDNQFAINLMNIEEEYAEDMWKRMVEIEKEFRKNDNNNSR